LSTGDPVEYLRAASVQSVDLPSEKYTRALGAAIARQARHGDVIALEGGLGAGKTTFARGFIRELTATDEEVVSPTFTLVQIYDSPAGEIWHFDLYRLEKEQDALELGLDDALSGGIVLIEWPQRLGALMPPRRLEIELAMAGPGKNQGRIARLAGDGSWTDRIERARADVQRS
jgi:tRNA threonylcarbamoyladenosine biosynthesis protein TsaE